jgi:hypothetical protein
LASSFLKKKTESWATTIARSPFSTTQSSWSLVNRRRRPRSTYSPKRFGFPPHSFEGSLASVFLETLVVVYSIGNLLLCCNSLVSLRFSCVCVPQEPCKGLVTWEYLIGPAACVTLVRMREEAH